MAVEGTDTPASAPEALPTIAELAAKMAPEMKGGSPTDPNIPEQGEGGKEEPAPVAAEAPKEEPKKEVDKTSSRFAALARREKAARDHEANVARQAREMEAREQAIREREARLDPSKKRRPLEALKDLGFTYADLTQEVLGQYKEPEEDPVDKKLRPLKEKWDKYEPNLEALKAELESLKSAMTQKQQQESYQAAMTEIRKTAADTERYELINAMGEEAIDLVRDTVVEYFNKHQRMLDYNEACSIVEKYYEDEYVTRLANTKKLKARVPAPQAAPSKPSPAKEAKETRTTLTNGQASAPKATNVDLDSMTKSEAIEYLAKKLQYK